MAKIKVTWSERMFYEAEIEVQGSPTQNQIDALLESGEFVTLMDGRNVRVWDELYESSMLTDEEDNFADSPVGVIIEE